MKVKSLRQTARELGVSASYLSQIRHGKRPASARVLSILGQSVKQNLGQIAMPREGLEPTLPYGKRILSPPRLPFRHLGRN